MTAVIIIAFALIGLIGSGLFFNKFRVDGNLPNSFALYVFAITAFFVVVGIEVASWIVEGGSKFF